MKSRTAGTLASDSTALAGHVFISYAHQDRDVATELRSELQAHKIDVWLDEDRLRPGSSIVLELERALESSSAVIVLVSPAALASGWVREEYGRALTLSIRAAYTLPIIPVSIDGATVPGFLENRRVIVLPARSDIDLVARQIARALSASPVSDSSTKRSRDSRIRLHSRVPGFHARDVSALAAAETALAVIAAVVVMSRSESLHPLGALILFAPLSLLQTARSRSLGIRWLRFTQWWSRLNRRRPSESRIPALFRVSYLLLLFGSTFVFSQSIALLLGITIWIVIALVLLPLIIRSCSVLLISLRHPVDTLRAVCLNWQEIVLRKDVLDEPEIVPGYLDAVATGEVENDFRIPVFIAGLARPPLEKPGLCDCGATSFLHAGMIAFFAIPAALAFYLPFYTTRFALKATAIVWAPLLWISFALRGRRLPLVTQLRLLSQDASNTVIYVLSWIGLILAAIMLPSSSSAFTTVCLMIGCSITIALRLVASRLHILFPYRELNERLVQRMLQALIVAQRVAVVLFLAGWIGSFFDM